uniref:Uncharacterized protein n=1 Tax=Anguilla anguilla TaxID=7936 RepID=A0A0E9W3U2_ANGAN
MFFVFLRQRSMWPFQDPSSPSSRKRQTLRVKLQKKKNLNKKRKKKKKYPNMEEI